MTHRKQIQRIAARLALAVAAALMFTPANGQGLTLVNGAKVLDDPNPRAYSTREFAPFCTAQRPDPCGRVHWIDRPGDDALFAATILGPAVLHGRYAELPFEPIIRCFTFYQGRVTPQGTPGASCTVQTTDRRQRVGFYIGGMIPDDLGDYPAGVYEGLAVIEVEHERERYSQSVPISWERYRRHSSCSIDGITPELNFGDIPYGFSGTVKINPKDAGTRELTDDLASGAAAVEDDGSWHFAHVKFVPDLDSGLSEMQVSIHAPSTLEPGQDLPQAGDLSYSGLAAYGTGPVETYEEVDLIGDGNVYFTIPITDELFYLRIGGTLHIEPGDVPRDDPPEVYPVSSWGTITVSVSCM